MTSAKQGFFRQDMENNHHKIKMTSLHQNFKLWSLKNTIKIIIRQETDWKKLFAKQIFTFYKELLKLNKNKSMWEISTLYKRRETCEKCLTLAPRRELKVKTAVRCHCTASGGSNPEILFFQPRCVAHGALLPQPGIEPGPSAMEGQSPNYWTTRSGNSLRQRNVDKT